MADNKVQLIIEALDKTKAAFHSLGQSFSGLNKKTEEVTSGQRGLNKVINNLVGFAALYKMASAIKSAAIATKEFQGELGEVTKSFNEMDRAILKAQVSLGTALTPAFLTISKAIQWVVDNAILPFIGGIEILGIKAGAATMKLGAIWDWMRSGFKGGIDSLKAQFKEFDKIADQMAMEVVKKFEGIKVKTPFEKEKEKEAKKKAEDIARAMNAFRKEIELLNPELDIFSAKILDLSYKANELVKLGAGKGQVMELFQQGVLSLSAEKAKKDAESWKQAQEAMINYSLSLVDLQEQERTITKAEAFAERIKLLQELLQIQEEYQNKIDKLKDPTGWYAQQNEIAKTRLALLELNKALKEQTGTISQGAQEGLRQYIDSVGSVFQQARDMARDTAQAMGRAFSDFFFDMFTGKLKTAEEYIKSFANSIYRIISDMISKLIIEYIALYVVQTITGMVAQGKYDTAVANTSRRHSGGLVMHEGGYVPRFHAGGGLSSDERPAILQTGEYVVSRKGVAALDNINSGNVAQPQVNLAINVENKSSQPVNAKQGDMKFDGKQYVVNVILEDINGYGPLRHAIAGVK